MAVNVRNTPDVRELAGILSARARRHGVPGAQLVVQRDGESTAVEFGDLRHGGGRRVTADTAFPIGSVTKAFTATTVLALVADGDLELDEPVGLHVRGLGGLGADLTVRQLLSHTGGLPCGPGVEQAAGLSPQRYIALTCRPELLVLPPGEGFSYSNVGYVLAGLIVESVTGMSWADAVDAILLRPLGADLDLIGVPGARPSGRPVATGHSVNAAAGRTRPVEQSLTAAEAAAGALALSATDLATLGRLHVGDGNPSVLPPEYAAQQRQGVPGAVPFGLADEWGLGLARFRNGTHSWYGHDGNADGTACYLRAEPEAGWVVAMTSNANTGHGLWLDILADLSELGIPFGAARTAPAALPVGIDAGCVGTYVNGDLEYVVTADANGRLRLSVDGDAADEIVVCTDSVFFMRDSATGQWSLGGRFLRSAGTEIADGIQVGGRLASRRVHTPVR